MEKIINSLSAAFVLLLFFILPFSASAMENQNARLNTDSYKTGDTVKVTVSLNESQNTAAFLLEVYYDTEKLSFKKTDNLSSCYMKSNDKNGCVSIAALSKTSIFNGDAFSISFTLLDDSDVSSVDLAFRDLVDSSGTQSLSDFNLSLSVTPKEKASSECELKSIEISDGKLNESFSPNVYSYTMNVPYSVKSLSFDCAVSDGAFYRVNRKNLGSGGSITNFVITVTAADGTKKEYTIAVTRGEYKSESSESSENHESSANSESSKITAEENSKNSSVSSNSEESNSGGDSSTESSLSGEAKLLSVLPSEGELNEEFSPDIYSYTMNVPYSVKSLSFDCTVSDGASYKVNRKNLGSGGSTTDFKITVTSGDGNSKTEYVISVTRGEYVRASGTKKSGSTVSASENEKLPLVLSLVPSEGALNEEFSSDVNKYTMNLPYEIKKLEFKVEVSDGASYTINRTTLGKGGSTVDFKITVKSADGKSKNIYVVSVTRGEKDASSSKSSSKKSESSKEYIEPEVLGEYNADSRLTIVGDRLPGFIIIVFLAAMFIMLTLICIKIFRKK